MKLNNERGISLIVLVITIIVMIILATAIILSIQDSGIIDKANEAKEKTDVSAAKEIAAMAEAEWELMSSNEKSNYDNSFSKYVSDKLEKAGIGKEFATVTENGDVVTGVAAKFISHNVPMGATIVGYNLSQDANAKTVVTDHSEDTYEEDGGGTPVTNPVTYTRPDSMTWSYMGIDDDGNALIVGTPVLSVKLSGKGGYLNGLEILDMLCNKMYSTNMGTARNIKIEDINKLLDYKGSLGQWVKLDFSGPSPVSVITELDTPQKLGTVLSGIVGVGPDGKTDVNDYYLNSYTIQSDSEDIKTNQQEARDLVFLPTEYWISSSIVNYHSQLGVMFGVRALRKLSYVMCVSSYNMVQGSSYISGQSAIRPVVVLDSSLGIKYDSSTKTVTLEK